jgi:hypothetical protein
VARSTIGQHRPARPAVAAAGRDASQRQGLFRAAFFLEQLLPRLHEVELGDQAVEPARVGAVDDGQDADAKGRHSLGHRPQDLVGIGDRVIGDAGCARRAPAGPCLQDP